MTLIGLSHSEISVSTFVCNLTELIAAYHVLHRLPVPRHPLCALSSLIENLLKKEHSSNAHFCAAYWKIPLTHLLYYYEVFKEPCGRRCDSPTTIPKIGLVPLSGDDRDRTGDLWLAKPPLSQLSYIPDKHSKFNGPKWNRTIDLALIRRAL